MSERDAMLHMSVRLEDGTGVTYFSAPSVPMPGDTIEVDPLFGEPRVRYVVTERACWIVLKRLPGAPIGEDNLRDIVVTVERAT